MTRPERLAIHPDALREIAGAVDWYAARDRRAAQGLAEEIQGAVDRLARTPERWRRHADGCRRCPLQRFPFSVVCAVRDGGIDILALAHASRRPGYWGERAPP